MRYYLAYGSNLNIRQMGIRCPFANVVGSAMIEGYQLLYKGSKTGAYLTIEKGNGAVPVGVWAVTEADERALDRYEGYPNFYYKETMVVEVDGEPVEAFVYIMHRNRCYGIPTREYVRICSEGYDSWGFDRRFLDEAYRRSMEGAHGLSKVRKAI